METYAEPKKLVSNDSFQKQRQKALATLNDDMLDQPITNIVNGFNNIEYCFTLQSCFGHFLYKGQSDSNNLDPLPPLPRTHIPGKIEYKIAYVALCIENNLLGRILMEKLDKISLHHPQNIQFCSAEWFWERQVNSYAIQVEPDRFKDKDRAILNYDEAIKIEKIKNEFFVQLQELINSL